MSGNKRKNECSTFAKRRAAAIELVKNNPASEWVEQTQIVGLTMYDIYGSEPREQLAEKDAEGNPLYLEVSVDELEKELRCVSRISNLAILFSLTRLSTFTTANRTHLIRNTVVMHVSKYTWILS